ncbi:hypothetical protein GCM10016455_13340 [Aliiroseovarius zhejiangensis]|uniref:PRC-barrel domain-containing protein n=1 Tax=Aliiroseovarius zhejiangensis TaxID=1632025 RepID=A0ABQ3ITX4_9RHOB|nr:hypothetical protein [Aliiroseovarius zhejiangensis]GHE94266.1 hypothetical protein GCM10016455_13340 [Aliiroseovarius zhejiangensis]
MKQKRAKKLFPIALAITAASALSAMALQTLPDTGPNTGPNSGLRPELALPAAFDPVLVGRSAGRLNIYEHDLNPILGAPVYDTARNFAGHVAELMVSAEGDVRGMVLSVPTADGVAVKRVAAQSSEFSVIDPTVGKVVVLTKIARADLQDRPEFAPDYATDFH